MDPGSSRDDEKSCAVTVWNRALARFHQAQATLDAASHEPDQGRYDALLDAHSATLSALLALPAPDLPALAAKLDHIIAHQAWENTGSEDCLKSSAGTPTVSPRRPLELGFARRSRRH